MRKLKISLAVLLALAFIGAVAYFAVKGALENQKCTIELSSGECVILEKVITQEDRAVGLSKYDSLEYNKGMLFEFSDQDSGCIWMKDMKFNIDILWLDKEQRVIKIEQNVSPGSYPEKFCPEEAASYVIETNAGVVSEAGISVGQTLSL